MVVMLQSLRVVFLCEQAILLYVSCFGVKGFIFYGKFWDPAR
jgi:hypothetical protein